jgi:hypothetical protein
VRICSVADAAFDRLAISSRFLAMSPDTVGNGVRVPAVRMAAVGKALVGGVIVFPRRIELPRLVALHNLDRHAKVYQACSL